MQEATQILTDEHQGIKRVLALIERANEKVETGQNLPPDFIPEVLDFIKTFADTCHHGKEEGVLFPFLEEHGIPNEGGPIGMMLLDHETGRGYVKEASDAFERNDIKKSLGYLRQYAYLLHDHINKEDNILYPMGNQVLKPQDNEYLIEEFEKIEKEKIGPGRHEFYHQMIEKWEKSLL